MMRRVIAIGALGIQIRLDEHHSFRRHMGALQVQHVPLANILNLARFAL
jgi:hypothetical protein